MNSPRHAAGLTWSLVENDEWRAEDDVGVYTLVEWAPGQWMERFQPHDESCGCGIPPAGGGDWPDFESAAAAAVALGRR